MLLRSFALYSLGIRAIPVKFPKIESSTHELGESRVSTAKIRQGDIESYSTLFNSILWTVVTLSSSSSVMSQRKMAINIQD